MEIDKIKECWTAEGKRISESVHVKRDVSFQTFRSSLNRIKIWRFIRIVQWFIAIPVLFQWGILPNMKNDGSGLFYVALVSLILITVSFCASYIYHSIYLSKIDLADSLSNVQRKISTSERLDKRIYAFRFFGLLVAFLCAYKLFGTPVLSLESLLIPGLFLLFIGYKLFVRLKFLIPKEYAPVKSLPDEVENGTEKER